MKAWNNKSCHSLSLGKGLWSTVRLHSLKACSTASRDIVLGTIVEVNDLLFDSPVSEAISAGSAGRNRKTKKSIIRCLYAWQDYICTVWYSVYCTRFCYEPIPKRAPELKESCEGGEILGFGFTMSCSEVCRTTSEVLILPWRIYPNSPWQCWYRVTVWAVISSTVRSQCIDK